MAITLLQLLHDEGVDVDAPVSSFNSGLRTGSTTARQLLEHRAGLPHIRDVAPTCGDLRDSEAVRAGLMKLRPLWEPGTRTAYHAVSYGYLIQAMAEELCGIPFANLIWQRLLQTSGVEPTHVGLPGHTLAPGAMSPLTVQGDPPIPWRPEGRSILYRSFYSLPELVELLNAPDGIGATVLSCGVPCSADAISRLYAALGAPLGMESAISDPVRRTIFASGTAAFDHVMLQRLTWRCGFLQGAGIRPLSANADILGLPGYGGSIGLCDRAKGVAIGLVASQLDADRVVGRETEQLCSAVLDLVGVDR